MKINFLFILSAAVLSMAGTCNPDRDASIRGNILIKKGGCPYLGNSSEMRAIVETTLSGIGLSGPSAYNQSVILRRNSSGDFEGTYQITAHAVKASSSSFWSPPKLDRDYCITYGCSRQSGLTDTSQLNACIERSYPASSSIQAQGPNDLYSVQYQITIECQCRARVGS